MDRTEFVGREAELAAVTSRLASARIVTVAGPGGSGKSRLAREILDHVDGDADVWSVLLATADGGRGVVETVSAQLGLLTSEGVDGLNALCDYLAPRTGLLLLDNCEHVLDEVRDLVDMLLTVAPELRILTTSRMSLGITGEHVYRLPSLSPPEAAALFRARATAARHDLVFDESTAPLVAQVCERMAGMPLGIELAAARLRSMSLRDLSDAVLSTLEAPTPGATTDPIRHRTLRSTIEWSYRELDDTHRNMFDRLAVFEGSFDLAAARALAGELADSVIDLLDSLVDRSLVEAEPQAGGGLRYRLLQPVKEFARTQLDERGTLGEHIEAHTSHFAELAATAEPELRGPDQVAWRDRLVPDDANLAMALTRVLEQGDVERHLRMSIALLNYWRWTGRHDFGRHTLVAGLEAAGDSVDATLATRAWHAAWELTTIVDAVVAVDHAERGLEVARRAGDDYAIGRMSLARAQALFNAAVTSDTGAAGLDEGRSLLDESTGWWSDPEWDEANVRWSTAVYAIGDPVAGRRTDYEEGVDRLREIGDSVMLITALAHSVFFIGQGFDDWVRRRLSEAIDEGRRIDHRAQLGHALLFLGSLNRFTDRGADAVAPLREAADLLEGIGDLDCATSALIHLALVADQPTHTHEQLAAAGQALLRLRATRVEGEFAIAVLGRALDVGDVEAASRFGGWASGFEHATSEAAVLERHLSRLHDATDSDTVLDGMKIGAEWRSRLAIREAIDWLSASPTDRRHAADDSGRRQMVADTFRREGDVWTVAFDGLRTQHRDKKAMHDLATLLAKPGAEVHVLDLMQAGVQASDLGEAIDDRTRRSYETRIMELQADLEIAEDAADLARAERIRIEMDSILEQLSAALGLSGRNRKVSGDAERARSAVTRRIREMIRELAEPQPALADHLTRSIRTGMWCAYDPPDSPAWDLG